MNEFYCDYQCRTVGEGIIKHNVAADWCAEFDVYDGVYPIFCIPVEQIREISGLMQLKLRNVENQDDEYAACVVFKDSKTISFKIDHFADLAKYLDGE